MALVLIVIMGVPSGLSANLIPGEGPKVMVADDRDHLQTAEERRQRRDARAAALGQRPAEGGRGSGAGQAEMVQLERELDRIVPQLLTALQRQAGHERAAAQALAALAGLTRVVPGLDMQARLQAISPVMLRRLQPQTSGLAQLQARAQVLIDRHHRLRAWQTLRRVEAAAGRLTEVAAGLARLAEEEAVLARRALRATWARMALLSITAERTRRTPLLDRSPARAGAEADLGKRRFDPTALAVASPAQVAVSARLATAAAGGVSGPARGLRAHARMPTVPSPQAYGSTGGERTSITLRAPSAASGSARSTFTAAIGHTLKVRRPYRPLVPAPNALLDPSLQVVDQRPVITMPAQPGQEVAAPDAGRVAFGGGFGSYGLLLILEHGRDYHTILWGFSELKVAPDEVVRAGDIIGVMGDNGSPELSVEFRRNGRPVGILPWLAASSSKVRG